MSTRKRGTTNIALSIAEITMLQDALQRDRRVQIANVEAVLEMSKLNKRLDMALERCKKNGGRPDPNWHDADRGIAPDMENE